MNGTNGNEPGYPEKALVPYPVILAATKGDPDAMKIVLQHFSGYIARLSMRKLYDERGNVYFGVDHDIRERLQAKLMMAVLTFKAEELINFTSYEQMNNRPKKEHKKIPPNLKTNSEGNLGYNKITHPNMICYPHIGQ